MKKFLLILALLFAPSCAWAQCTGVFPPNTLCGNLTGSPRTPGAFSSAGGVFGPGSTTAGNIVTWGNTGGTLLAAGFPPTLIPYDIRITTPSLNCTGGVDASTAVAAAISAGHTRLLLPAGCFYQPPTSGGNEHVPAGVVIYGDPANLNASMTVNNVSVVRSANRATSTDSVMLDQGAGLVNIAIQQYSCDQTTSPLATQKLCPILEPGANNSGAASIGLTNWAFQRFQFTCDTIASPFAQDDQPCFSVTQNSLGDGGFFTTLGGGISLRVQTQGSGDVGLAVQNSITGTAVEHTGIWCLEYGKFAGTPAKGCLTLEKTDASTYPLIFIKEDGPTTYTSTVFQWNALFWSGGNLLSIFQANTASNGNFILINAGNTTGTFTGNFLQFSNAGSAKFTVNSAGNATAIDVTTGDVAAFIKTSVALNNGAGVGAGTITNAPAAGNPTKWIPINDNGTVRFVPAW